jgi:hypothetical protein
LRARGHAVRATTRDPANVGLIETAGAVAVVGDPDRIATLAGVFDHVSVACLLLGSASGAEESVASLHGPRLEMLLSRMLDTTVRGILYETVGTVDGAVLQRGADTVRAVCEDSRIPYELFAADPSDHATWLPAACQTIEALLAAQ